MIEHKTVKFALKALTDDGTFEGYAAVYGVIDLMGDIIEAGAFRRSIDHKGGKFPILAAHDITQEIGIAQVEEDQKGLHVLEGRLYLHEDPRQEVPAARVAYVRMKRRHEAGMPMGMSIGYETLNGPYVNGVRHLKECRLWEVSTDVTFPAQPLAGVTDVKAVVPYQDLPLAARERAWDGTAAAQRVRVWAGAMDGLETAAIQRKYRQAFAWYDADAPDIFSSYKLGLADVLDGTLTAIPRGIFAVAAVLQGARGGVAVPADDMPRLRAHLARYYAKMRTAFDDDTIIAPWLEESAMPPAPDRKDMHMYAQTFAQIQAAEDLEDLYYVIQRAWSQSLWSIIQDEQMPVLNKLELLRTSGGQMLDALLGWAQQYLATSSSMGTMAAAAALEAKANALLFSCTTALAAEQKVGAVLSAQNRAIITNCITQLQALLASATTMDGTAVAGHVPEIAGVSVLATLHPPGPGITHPDGLVTDEVGTDDLAGLQTLLATLHTL